MKIGILTLPFNNNYGGFLQAYALKKVLVSMGHEVVFISRRRNRPKRSLIKRVLGYPYFLLSEYRLQKQLQYLSKNTDVFKKKYLSPITENYYTSEDIKKCLDYHFDAIVVGSDQVWRYKSAKDSIDDFFCNFLQNTGIRHISYAASFGTDKQEYPLSRIESCSKLLNSFSAISVREEAGKTILTKYFGVQESMVEVVLDPTMLLSAVSYKTLIDSAERSKEPYLFSYILDKNASKRQLIDYVRKAKNIAELSMDAQTGDIQKLKTLEPVELWLNRIFFSDFVVTDSFHGAVFSILFNKPFIVYGNTERGKARFDTLLRTFGLESRYVDDFNQSVAEIVDTDIDWNRVNNILENKANKSMNYLKLNLI